MANTGQQSIVMDIKNALPYGDKIGHIGMYGSLTLFANYAFKFRYFGNNKMNQYGAVLALFFSTTEEFSQIFIVTRSFSLSDMAANLTGVTVFTLLSIYLGKQSSRYNQRLIEAK